MKNSDASELSKIIATSGDWKQWCTHLEVDESTCNLIDHSREHDTVKPLRVAEAYLNQLDTCWEKVVEILCKKLISPKYKMARTLAEKHKVNYSTICKTQ